MNRNEYRKDAEKLINDAKDKNNADVKLLSANNVDGWKNALSGLGGARDKSIYTKFQGFTVLSWDVLSDIWVGDGLGSRIVSCKADDMTREWIHIEGDAENEIQEKLQGIEAPSMFNLALKWQRLFGGSIIVMGIDDNRSLEEPVNIKGIKSIDYLRVYDLTDVYITNMNYYNDIESKDYGKLEYFTVSTTFGHTYNVHRDRVLEFKGIPVPNRLKNDMWWYWGMSVLQQIWEELKSFSENKGFISTILQEFIIGVYKLKDLAMLIAEGNRDKLKNRINAIDESKSILNSILLDTEEDFSKISSSVAGMPELLDRLMMFISGVSGIPVTRLFGRSPAGMNSTGESDLRNYYDSIVPEQNNKLRPQLQTLVNYINASAEIKNKIEKPVIKFNKLYQLTETEELINRERQSVIDERYLNINVLNDEEVRKSRFKNGYSYDTSLEENNEDIEIDL